MKNIELQPVAETLNSAEESEIFFNEQIEKEQTGLEKDKQEVKESWLNIKIKIGKLLKIGYGTLIIFNLLVGAVGKAKAEEIMSPEASGDDIELVDDPSKDNNNDVDDFLVDEDNLQVESELDENFDNVAYNKEIAQLVKKAEDCLDNPENLGPLISKISNLYFEYNYSLNNQNYVDFVEISKSLYKQDDRWRPSMYIDIINNQARQYLNNGDIEGAIGCYSQALDSGNEEIDKNIETNIKALKRLPDDYRGLSEDQKMVEEMLAYNVEDSAEISSEFADYIRDHVNLGELKGKLESRYGLDFPGSIILRFTQDNLLDYQIARQVPGFGAPDTLYFEQSVFKHSILDRILFFQNSAEHERTMNLAVLHELIHSFGSFDLKYQRWGAEQFDRFYYEGLTDLIARREYPGKDEVFAGYPYSSGMWGNLSYILGHQEDKSPEQCFNDGLDFIGQNFLGNHSLIPIQKKLEEMCNAKGAPIEQVKDILNQNPDQWKYLLPPSKDKINNLLNLAEDLGIDLNLNFDNLRNMGITKGECKYILKHHKQKK